jgi:hypothetical protein
VRLSDAAPPTPHSYLPRLVTPSRELGLMESASTFTASFSTISTDARRHHQMDSPVLDQEISGRVLRPLTEDIPPCRHQNDTANTPPTNNHPHPQCRQTHSSSSTHRVAQHSYALRGLLHRGHCGHPTRSGPGQVSLGGFLRDVVVLQDSCRECVQSNDTGK